MHYSDYFCGMYEICFRSPAKLKSPDDSDQRITKFLDYSDKQITDSLFTTTGLHLFAPKSKVEPTITEQIKANDSDIVPKTCAGDWLLRYTENETNFNPWHLNAKSSRFELVPWRQQNKKIDLINAIGWEAFDASESNQQLRTLHKFELARTKRLRKQHIKRQRDKFRRQIKIRFILSFEVRQRAMKMKNRLKSKAVVHTTQQRKLVLERERQMIVFDERAYDLSAHWGYFSQRNKGVEELLVSNMSNRSNVMRGRLPIIMNRSSTSSSNRSTGSLLKQSEEQSVSSGKSTSGGGVVLCKKCRERCVFLLVFTNPWKL